MHQGSQFWLFYKDNNIAHTILICHYDNGACGWSRAYSDSCGCDGVCVEGVQGKESEVGGQGDVALSVSSLALCDVHQIVPDDPVLL